MEPGSQRERAALDRHCDTYNLKAGSTSPNEPRELNAGVVAVARSSTSSRGLNHQASARWEVDQQSGAWWRRQFIRNVGHFVLAVARRNGQVAGKVKPADALEQGPDLVALSSTQRMDMCTLKKVEGLS